MKVFFVWVFSELDLPKGGAHEGVINRRKEGRDNEDSNAGVVKTPHMLGDVHLRVVRGGRSKSCNVLERKNSPIGGAHESVTYRGEEGGDNEDSNAGVVHLPHTLLDVHLHGGVAGLSAVENTTYRGKGGGDNEDSNAGIVHLTHMLLDVHLHGGVAGLSAVENTTYRGEEGGGNEDSNAGVVHLTHTLLDVHLRRSDWASACAVAGLHVL